MNPENNKPIISQVLTQSELAEKGKEKKAAYTKWQRKYRAKLTPEQKVKFLKNKSECYKNMIPEQKCKYLIALNEKNK